ncbi:ABC transporter permease [Bdellovibrio sp. HCB2-146]|uniref:ABC transporter permease n=1 Tax=Bdellovibrio sp. HCB2-146 TaxID=3394362 RepID=UPI0039BCB125
MKSFSRWIARVFLAGLMFAIFFGPWILGEQGYEQNMNAVLEAPSSQHWFGTDSLGRDLFARTLMGGRVSVLIGLVSALLTFALGFVYGSIAGWMDGWIDRVLMRFCDILMAIPSFILVSVFCLSFQSILHLNDPHTVALLSLCFGISITHWMSLARVTRGLVMETKRRSFIEAAIALGGTKTHIITRHIFPHVMSSLLVLVALQIPTSILYESFMSFIGLGIHPPETSWGILMREGWKSLSSFPYLLLLPSLLLFLTVWSFHILLDDFREAKKDI